MNDKTGNFAKDRYTSGYNCKSWHGSLNPSDSYVPLIVAYPKGNKAVLEDIIKEACGSLTGCNGNWQMYDIIKAIMKRQYPKQQ